MYWLFQKLHEAHNAPMIERLMEVIKEPPGTQEKEQESYYNFFGSGDFITKPIFYGGTGAYDFQYLEFAPKKYEQDCEWMQSSKRISILEISTMAMELKKLHEHKNMVLPKTENFEDYCKASFDVFCFKKEDIGQFGKEKTDNFLELFVTKPGEANQKLDSVGAYNQIESHPIVLIGDDSYFLPINFALTQSVYENPFYWMSRDKSYKDTSFKHRGEAPEKITAEILKSIFGKEKVYKNVKVLKSNRESLTEIDVLAVAGNKAVVIQAKSKKLTELSKKGDEKKLKEDFGKAIQEAYEQGLICRAAIIDKANILIDENNKEMKLQEFIDDAYIICITLDHYPAITHQLDIYLKKSPESPYPLAMSIFDLDIVAFYLKDPFEFLYYLRQRVNLNKYFMAGSEMAFLGCHLKQKLYPRPGANREALAEEFAQLIDANFPVMRGHHPKTSAVEKLHHQWKNEKFNKLVEQVKSSRHAGFTDAVFYLYDLAGKGADDLIKIIEETKEKTIKDNQSHDFSMIFEKGKSGVSFLSSVEPPEKLEDSLMPFAVARKYKTRANLWLALGSITGSPNFVDAVAFNKEVWKEDEELSGLAKIALKGGVAINQEGNKVGRNDRCYCQSGKKYKKCCGR